MANLLLQLPGYQILQLDNCEYWLFRKLLQASSYYEKRIKD